MKTRYLYLLRFTLAWSDLVLVNLCFFLGFYLSNKYGTPFDPNIYRSNFLICTLIWVISTGIFGLYSDCTINKVELIYRSTWRSIILHIFLFVFYLFSTNQNDFPKLYLISFNVLLIFGFVLSRFTGTAFQSILVKNYDIRKAVAVLSLNSGATKLASYLKKQSSLNFVGFLGEKSQSYVGNDGTLTLPWAAQQLKEAANSGVEEVFVSIDPYQMDDLTDLIKEGEKQCVRLKFVPDLSSAEANFKFEKMGDFTVLCARNEPLENIENRVKKRLFDIVVSFSVVVFILSWLYPILALMIKLQSPGPVLFKQLRTGRDNKPFLCYKFRSMRINLGSNFKQATVNDDRITPIGRFLRKSSLDEFPQFINVLFGNMSIIGPRPHMLAHTETYREIIDKYMVRQFLKPGISGWAQVNGYRGETKEQHLMEKRVKMDIWYMENWSLMLDIKVMFLTVINIFKGEENAY